MSSINRLSIGFLTVAVWIMSASALANEPADPAEAFPANEQEAIDAINQLSSPDGPEVRGNANGGSELTGVMVDRTITMAGKTFIAPLASGQWIT